MNMDPDALEKAFSTGLLPKAVIVVHVYGTPANMDRIMNICSRYGVPVIEDATESFGAVADGEMVGTIGDFGCLSFNGNKMITAGGTGGMLICRNEEEARRVAFIASQAIRICQEQTGFELCAALSMFSLMMFLEKAQQRNCLKARTTFW